MEDDSRDCPTQKTLFNFDSFRKESQEFHNCVTYIGYATLWTEDAFNSSRGVPPLHLLWLYVPPGTLHAMLEVHWVLAAV